MEWHNILLYIFYTVVSVVTILYLFIKSRFSYWKNHKIPFVKPEIPYGCLRGAGTKRHMIFILNDIYKKYKKKFDYIGAYFYINPVIIAISPEFVKKILVTDFNYFQSRGLYLNERDDPISAHLLTLEGKKWKNLRAKLTPTFTSGKMKIMYSTMTVVSDRLNQTLGDIIKTEEIIEIKDLLLRFTIDVIGSCAMGIECNSLTDSNAPLLTFGKRLFKATKFWVLMRFFKNQFPEISRFFRLTLLPKDLQKFFFDVVCETIEYREKNDIHRNDFLDSLIALKNDKYLQDENGEKLEGLSIYEIAAQTFLFFGAGFETSATTMSFALYELAVNQDLQDRTRNETQKVLDKCSGEFSYEAMVNMTYLDQIINETLRLHPPSPIIQRKCVKDYPIDNSGKIIEKGTFVYIPSYSIHLDPEIYPQPDIFNPDRFSPKEKSLRNPSTFLGFGDGPRNCLAMRFGRMQVKVGLVTLLRNYRFKICNRTPIPMKYSPRNSILKSDTGIFLLIEKL